MRKMMMRLYIRLTVDKEEFRRRFGIYQKKFLKRLLID